MSTRKLILSRCSLAGVKSADWFRAAVQRAVDDTFQGNTTAAAKAWGMPQSGLQQFLAGQLGAGMKTVRRIAPHLPDVVAEYLGMPGTRAPADLPQLDAVRSALAPSLQPETRGYASALARLWRVDRTFGEWAQMLHDFDSAHHREEFRRPVLAGSHRFGQRLPESDGTRVLDREPVDHE